MSSKFTGKRAGQTPRHWSVSAVAVITSCAAVTVLAVGGTALASNPSATGATSPNIIKACYPTTTSPSTLKHVPTTAHCPRGYTGLIWNKIGPQGPQGIQGAQGPQGPQGPAGVASGSAGLSAKTLALTTVPTLSPVLSGGTTPSSGQYYVNASVMFIVGQGDTVTCILDDNGTATGTFATVGPVTAQTYETLPLSGDITMAAGDNLGVMCAEYTGNATTEFFDGAITAVLIGSPTSSAVRVGTTHRQPPAR